MNAILYTASKAVAGGVVSFVGAVATGYADDQVMTVAEWWGAAAVALAAAYAVWQVPNRDAPTGP